MRLSGDVNQEDMSQALKTASSATLLALRPLFDCVEDLIKRVADIESSEILKIRAEVRLSLLAARSALENGL